MKNAKMKINNSNSFQITTTLKLNIGNDFQKSLIQNKHLQGAIKKCLSYEMTMLFGIFYSPNDIIMKVFKNGSIEIIYKSNLFIFQPFQEWFVKKEHDLKQIWNKWNGQMKFSDLYFIGRYYDDSLKTLLGLNLDLRIDIQDDQGNIQKQIILKQKQVSFYQEAQQSTSLISPNFELQTFVVQKKQSTQNKSSSQSKTAQQKRKSKFNIYLLTEQNDLWMDDLIRIDVQYQLPMNKLVYQSFNLLHFLEHSLLAFKQEAQEKYNIKYTNGSTAQSGCMMISIVLSVSHLKEFVEMFVNRQSRMYSKLEADRIVQEMYQVGEYKDCLREIAFLHNSDFQNQDHDQKQQYDWNKILYDLYTQLEIVQVFVQISSHISYKTQNETENILKCIKQMVKIPSPRDTYIKKYFESFGSFNQLPLFMYKTLIKIKTSILKMENIKVVPFVYAQDSENIYLLKEHFDYLDKIIEKGLNMEVYDVFNPFNRFFAFEELQQCWIEYNKETIDRIQYQGSLKTEPVEQSK